MFGLRVRRSRACRRFRLSREGAEVTVVSRDPNAVNLFKCPVIDYAGVETLRNHTDIVINATPLGTRGILEKEFAVDPGRFKNLQLAYDLVYNPIETAFLLAAKKRDIPTLGGLEMLVAQGIHQFEIWTGEKAPYKTFSRAALSGVA